MKLKRKRDNSAAKTAPAVAPALPFASSASTRKLILSDDADISEKSLLSSRSRMLHFIDEFSLPVQQKEHAAPPPPKQSNVRFDEKLEERISNDFVKKSTVAVEANFDLTSSFELTSSLLSSHMYSANTPITSSKVQPPNLDVLWKTPKNIDGPWSFQARKVQWQDALQAAFRTFCSSTDGLLMVDYDGPCTYNLFDVLFYKHHSAYRCIIANPSLSLLSMIRHLNIPLHCTTVDVTMHQRMDPTRCVYVVSGRRHIFGVIDCISAAATDVKSRRELYILPNITASFPFTYSTCIPCSVVSYRDNALDKDVSDTKKSLRVAVFSGVILPHTIPVLCEKLKQVSETATPTLSLSDIDDETGVAHNATIATTTPVTTASSQDSLLNPFRVRTSAPVVIGGVALPQVSDLRAQQNVSFHPRSTGCFFKLSLTSNAKFYPYALASCHNVVKIGASLQYSVISDVKWSQGEEAFTVTKLLLPETSIQSLDIKLLDKSDKGVEVVLEPLNVYSKFVE